MSSTSVEVLSKVRTVSVSEPTSLQAETWPSRFVKSMWSVVGDWWLGFREAIPVRIAMDHNPAGRHSPRGSTTTSAEQLDNASETSYHQLMDDDIWTRFFGEETRAEKPPPLEAARDTFNWAEYRPVEIRLLKKIINERLRELVRLYGQDVMKQYTHNGRKCRIMEMDLHELMSEYVADYGHTVVDEMNIRRGLAVELSGGQVAPSDKWVAREEARYKKRVREEKRASLVKNTLH
jgi:hypothetical protein